MGGTCGTWRIKLQAYRVLVRNPGGKTTLVSPRHIRTNPQ